MLFDKRLLVFALLWAGCNNEESTPATAISTTDSAVKKDTVIQNTTVETDTTLDSTFTLYSGQDKPYEGQYCYITNLYNKEGAWFIEADYIEFYLGDAAVEAAKKRKDAMIDVLPNGDTVYSLMDDIYIVNENQKKRTLPLDPNVEFLQLLHVDGKPYFKPAPIKELEPNAKNPGMYVLTINNNVVTHIRQQYLP